MCPNLGPAATLALFSITAAVVGVCGVLLTRLLRRERQGPLNIGFEGGLVLAVYLSAVPALSAMRRQPA
ncbi:MAG: hypothetical protein HWE39_00920 [Oceanospirillaceae bacterium]|nr:hypothetical protein [Oceanospirillaceae bacterium]